MYKDIMHANRDQATGSYAEQRMGNRRDDRDTDSKHSLDAQLRGKLGATAANRIIDALDNIKSRR